MSSKDLFWSNNFHVLIDDKKLSEIVPTPNMSLEERLNAISRFLIYTGTLLMIIYKNFNMIYITLIGLVLIYLIYEHYPGIKQTGGDTHLEYLKDHSQLPTQNNPFMNVMLSDYTDNPNKKPAADLDNEHVKEEVSKHFNDGLYRDANDIWNKDNSQRQYYSTPSTTIPNDRDSFMKWCYNTPYSCKEGELVNCIYGARELSTTELLNGPIGPIPLLKV